MAKLLSSFASYPRLTALLIAMFLSSSCKQIGMFIPVAYGFTSRRAFSSSVAFGGKVQDGLFTKKTEYNNHYLSLSTGRVNWRLYSSSSSGEKARIVFLGTPEVAATSLQAIVEDSKKEDRYVYFIRKRFSLWFVCNMIILYFDSRILFVSYIYIYFLFVKISLFEVVGVVTQPPKRRKRRGKVIPSPVGFAAEELEIPVLCPEKVRL